MQYTPKGSDPVFDSLEPVVKGLGMSLVDCSVSRQKGSIHIRLIVYKNTAIGVDDCSRVHHSVTPRLELAFPGQDLYIEVSSPGIDRVIKDASEFQYYIGRGIKCYRTDISDWSAGILISADTTHLILKRGDGEVKLNYDIIAKAKLDYSQEGEG
ncbi:ribosome assembly cofactor RimP [Breznakiella homolactica]|uniref:Ribosome maturation factor RimP n=1 Tax=Breznakiella homolactica TaxID=2798577 RepID=A0A7T8B983_9SPIR|nr:ribosome assembly cofactor RimP [Breznakiella homolactica]QQO08192.1 ribosome assembly cofactor RimP [Breznakiella homolactica]